VKYRVGDSYLEELIYKFYLSTDLNLVCSNTLVYQFYYSVDT
jgi:hypothetical protein